MQDRKVKKSINVITKDCLSERRCKLLSSVILTVKSALFVKEPVTYRFRVPFGPTASLHHPDDAVIERPAGMRVQCRRAKKMHHLQYAHVN